MIKIKCNGKECEIKENQSVMDIVKQYNLNPKTVVVELNRNIIMCADFENTTINQNDVIELINFVGGG